MEVSKDAKGPAVDGGLIYDATLAAAGAAAGAPEAGDNETTGAGAYLPLMARQ